MPGIFWGFLMTRRNPKERQIQEKIDEVLEGCSDELRAKVLKLVSQQGWDMDDPIFLVAVSTAFTQVSLEEFPKEFAAQSNQVMMKMQQLSREMQESWQTHQRKLHQWLEGLEITGDELTKQLRQEITGLQDELQQQRQWSETKIQDILTQTNLEKQRLQTSIQQQVQISERQFYAIAQKHAAELATQQQDIWIQKALKETLFWSTGGTIFVLVVGIALGTVIHQYVINNFTDTPWAVQLWQWNQPFYRECHRQNRTTCNFRIVPPEEK